MSLPVTLRSVVEEEIAAAALWYEYERKGVGLRFLDMVEHSLTLIGQFPALYSEVLPEIRRGNILNFPYVLFYVVEETEVVVLGCRHVHQDPVKWPKR